MYLTLAKAAPNDSIGGFEFFRFLPANAEFPQVGTLTVTDEGATSAPPTYSASISLPWARVTFNNPLEPGQEARLTIDSLQGELAYGRFQMQLRQDTAPRSPVSIRGTFIASRRATFESLPRFR